MSISHLASATVAFGILAAGCHANRSPSMANGQEARELAGSVAGYLTPPRVIRAQATRTGDIRVSGAAPPLAIVQITAPEGDHERTKADRRGAWSVTLPGGRPRLYAISALLGPRSLHAEGALVTAPGAISSAVMVRAGYAALPLTDGHQMLMSTIDYDPQGTIAVAGDAPRGAKVRLAIDGAPAAVGQASAQGRYALEVANRRLNFGAHSFQVRVGEDQAVREVMLDPPAALSTPYQAWATAQGWRVEWALNGGGVQTTLVLSSSS